MLSILIQFLAPYVHLLKGSQQFSAVFLLYGLSDNYHSNMCRLQHGQCKEEVSFLGVGEAFAVICVLRH